MIKISTIEKPEDITPELIEGMAELLPQVSSSFSAISMESMKEIIGTGNSILFIAQKFSDAGGDFVGSLTLLLYSTPTGKKSRIEDVVVDENYRGQGIGSKLSLSAIEKARELGADFIDLTSKPDREAANNMYKKLGFEIRDTNVYRKKL